MWPFRPRTNPEIESLRRAVSELQAQGVPSGGSPSSPAPAIPVLYQVDQETLRQVAAGKGVSSTAIRVELGQTASESASVSGGFSAKALGISGELSHLGQTTNTEERRLILEQGGNLIHLLHSTLAALEADNQIRKDLLELPKTAEEEIALLRATQSLPARWSIDTILPVDAEQTDTDDEPLDADPADSTMALVNRAVDLVKMMAFVGTQQEKAREYKSLAKNGELTALESNWTVVDDEARGLCLQPVSPYSVDWLPNPIRHLLLPLYVALDPNCLTEHGRARLVAGTRIWATVFGTAFFEGRRKDQHVGEARIAPIAVVGDLCSQ